MSERASRPRTLVVGAGRLAAAFLPRLRAAGYPILGVVSKSRGSGGSRGSSGDGGGRSVRARRIDGIPVRSDPGDAAARAQLVLLAVPDREIAAVARALATRRHDWTGCVAIHHAGALGPEPLGPLARRGAGVAVLHPLQALGTPGGPRASLHRLDGSRARIEGDAAGRAAARRLARDLGLVPLALRPAPGPRARAAYHTAASLASNDLLALMALALGRLESAGAPPTEALRALLPLARGTLDRIEAWGIARALTGPVARGDAATVAVQLASLAEVSPEAVEIHRLLGAEILEIAGRSGALDGPALRAMRVLLTPARR